MISQGIGREIIQALEPIVLIQMSMREPIKLSTTHFVLCTQSFNSSKILLRKLMHWEWRGMVVIFVLEQAINFGKLCFSYGVRKHPEIGAQTIPHPCVSLPHAAGARWVFSLTFLCNLFIFLHGWKPVFVLRSRWGEGIHVLGVCRGHFSPVKWIKVF